MGKLARCDVLWLGGMVHACVAMLSGDGLRRAKHAHASVRPREQRLPTQYCSAQSLLPRPVLAAARLRATLYLRYGEAAPILARDGTEAKAENRREGSSRLQTLQAVDATPVAASRQRLPAAP